MIWDKTNQQQLNISKNATNVSSGRGSNSFSLCHCIINLIPLGFNCFFQRKYATGIEEILGSVCTNPTFWIGASPVGYLLQHFTLSTVMSARLVGLGLISRCLGLCDTHEDQSNLHLLNSWNARIRVKLKWTSDALRAYSLLLSF